MKSILRTILGLIVFASSGLSTSQTLDIVNDSDLSGGYRPLREVEPNLAPDQLVAKGSLDKGTEIAFQVFYQRNGMNVPVTGLTVGAGRTGDDGRVQILCNSNGSYTIPLSTEYFQIRGSGGRVYQVDVDATCGQSYDIVFAEKSDAGQALSIFETFERGRKKLEATVGLDFWRQRLRVQWPSNGDYYSFGTVNVTLGYQWDVVAHEMGHAIYDMADLGGMQGSAHKIDECYTPTLALSEGWASFYAGWLYVDLADPDAKFQYLVPRRAPIRFENVPADVCRQVTNEWRVTAFFWDLIDTNNDNETVAEPFAKHWQALKGSGVSGLPQAIDRLRGAGFPASDLNQVFKNNF
jgi:hypothetical protein